MRRIASKANSPSIKLNTQNKHRPDHNNTYGGYPYTNNIRSIVYVSSFSCMSNSFWSGQDL